jgi:uncharacterized damage-inducible protein DinB
MKRTERLADQLQRAYSGPAWHGPALAELLADVDAPAAAARPLPGAHSIWEIVAHVAAWNEVPRRRIEGDPVRSLPDAEDWPPVDDPSPETWQAALVRLADAHRRLQEIVAGLGEERLDDPMPGTGPTVEAMLDGVIQHNLYHAGQIAVLKKAAAGAAEVAS